MNRATQELIKVLEVSNLEYTQVNDCEIKLTWSGENTPTITTIFTFNDDETDVLISSSITKIPEDKLLTAHCLCTVLNAKNRWLKFYLNSDNRLIAETDSIVEAKNAGMICLILLHKTVEIIDSEYWVIINALMKEIN